MNRLQRTLVGSLVASIFMGGSAHGVEPIGPKFPTGFREWTHVKSMLIHSDAHSLFIPFSGLHHIYVNKAGLAAAKAHGKYADGSILVFELLQSDDVGGAFNEGARKLVAVMQKDAKKYKDTGGWGFQAFKAGDATAPVVTDPVAQCFTCHQSQKESDFVFSTFRE